MRVFRISNAYPVYLQKFYRTHRRSRRASFQRQKDQLNYDGFGWADFWEVALAPLGIELQSAIANAHAMQSAWAAENVGDGRLPSIQILAEQVKRFRPDALFIEDASAVSVGWLREIRQTCPSIRGIVGWCGAPYDALDTFREFQVILSNIPALVEEFRGRGVAALHFRHAFEPRLLSRIDCNRAKRMPLTFVGQIVLGKGQHNERLRVLEHVAANFPIDIFSPLADAVPSGIAARANQRFVDVLLQAGISRDFVAGIPFLRRGLGRAKEFGLPFSRPSLHPSVFGLPMFQTLRDSHLTLNSHIDVSRDSASNVRLFEATGVGTCLITDWKADLKQIFELDVEVVTYRSPEELCEKISWLIDHPRYAQEIAMAGQRRTLRDHTFKARAPLLAETITAVVRGTRPD